MRETYGIDSTAPVNNAVPYTPECAKKVELMLGVLITSSLIINHEGREDTFARGGYIYNIDYTDGS